MANRSVVRRPDVPRDVPAVARRRRRSCGAQRLYRCAVALTILGSVATSGCRGDGNRRSETSPFRPSTWFANNEDSASPPAGESTPNTRRNVTPPPVPPPAPLPEPARSTDAEDFYGVRRTTAENDDAVTQRDTGLQKAFASEPQDSRQPDSRQPQVYRGGDAAPLLRPVPGHQSHFDE